MSAARPRARGRLWAGLAGVGIVVGSLITPALPAQAADLSDAGAAAFADVAACAASSEHLLAAVVVDSSGSLRQTDPADQRVGAIHTAIDALEQLGTASAGALDVQATLATFGASYEELVAWGSLASGHGELLRSETTESIPARDRDNFTDYRVALRGAQQSLDSRAAALSGSSCKVLLWFTDGRLDVDGTGAGAATDAARAELCAPQGLLDGLRGDGVTVVALALFTAGGDGSVTDLDRERLRAVAEGASAAETCGASPIAASSAGGAYLRADDAGALRRVFAQAAALISGGTPGMSVACPDAVCVGGQLRIPTDRGVGGFRVVVERAPGGVPPRLVAADGSSLDLETGTAAFSGADLAVTDRSGLLVADVRFPGSGATGGDWTLVTDPSVTSLVDLYYYWGVSLDVDAPDGLVAGETGTVLVVPRYTDGTAITPADLGTVDMSVTIDGVRRDVHATDTVGWALDIPVPASDVPPSMHVEAVARATTRASGIRLGPVSGSVDLPTSFPPSFATIRPARLDLLSIVDDSVSSGTLTFLGSDRGITRACFGPAVLKAPSAAGAVRVVPSAQCVDVPASKAVAVDIDVSASAPATGRVNGVLPVTLESVDGTDSLTVAVPVGLSMSQPIDEATRWGWIAVFTVLAVLLAWATAEVARRISDRFCVGPDTRTAAVPVVVTRTGVRRDVGGSVELLSSAVDFEPLLLPHFGRTATFKARGLIFGRSFGWFPLSSGQAWVRRTDGGILVSPRRDALMLAADGSRAPAEFPGPVGFVLTVDSVDTNEAGESSVRGRLIVLVDSKDGVAAVLPERLEKIAAAPWDRIVEQVEVASQLRQRPASPGPVGQSSPGRLHTPASSAGAGPDRTTHTEPSPSMPDWSSEVAAERTSSVSARPIGKGFDWDMDPEPAPRSPSSTHSTRATRRGSWTEAFGAKQADRRRDATPATSEPEPPTDPVQQSIVNFWD